MKELGYVEILKRNKELETALDSPPYKIFILSNTTINLIKEILEYSLRVEGINAQVEIGNFDNIVQDSIKSADTAVTEIEFYMKIIFQHIPPVS